MKKRKHIRPLLMLSASDRALNSNMTVEQIAELDHILRELKVALNFQQQVHHRGLAI